MKLHNENSNHNGKILSIVTGIVGFCGGILWYKYITRNRQPHSKLYLFVDEYGKTYSLTEDELIEIAQEHKTRVLMSVIAKKHNLSITRLSRVLTFIRNQSTFNL